MKAFRSFGNKPITRDWVKASPHTITSSVLLWLTEMVLFDITCIVTCYLLFYNKYQYFPRDRIIGRQNKNHQISFIGAETSLLKWQLFEIYVAAMLEMNFESYNQENVMSTHFFSRAVTRTSIRPDILGGSDVTDGEKTICLRPNDNHWHLPYKTKPGCNFHGSESVLTTYWTKNNLMTSNSVSR